MTSPLVSFQEYGKENVRLVKVIKHPDGKHEILELKVSLLLSGKAFETSYTEADNKNVVATDSMRNIVYVVANQSKQLPCIEKFGIELGEFMLSNYPKLVERVSIGVEKARWSRLEVNGKPHAHTFGESANGRRLCHVEVIRGPAHPTINVESMVTDVSVLKTTGSSFSDFYRDNYATLADAADRILSTSITCKWRFAPIRSFADAYANHQFCAAFNTAYDISLDEFASVASPSVQATLYTTCKRILDKLPQVNHVHMELPNRHVFNLDLPVFKTDHMKQNPPKDIYLPLAQPNGLIKATVSRANAPKL